MMNKELMMKITRTSIVSGKTRTMDLPVTALQMRMYEQRSGLVQEIFPELTEDQREFIMTGMTAEEWNDHFGGDRDCFGEDTDC